LSPGLSFVWTVAYDWARAVEKIVQLWPLGGEHVIGWDMNGRTWGGGEFFPPSPLGVRSVLERHGLTSDSNRVRLASAAFWAPGMDRGACELHNRNALTWLARPESWIVTLDADEELVDPAAVMGWLRCLPLGHGTAYTADFAQVYKVIGDVALVWSRTAPAAVALDQPGLWVGCRSVARAWPSPFKAINWWLAGRSDAEILLKAGALEYAQRHEPMRLLEQWRAVTLENCHEVRGWAGQIVPQHVKLVPIAINDLRAGRWAKAGLT
jgi:hypothetical protein